VSAGVTARHATSPATPDADSLTRWGIDPAWSRQVTVAVPGGSDVDWHVLDTGPGPRGTVVCVHGNPTWSYLWKGFLETLAPGWRVIAVDQTGMGWSERAGPRVLADRVDELVAFCRQEAPGPIVLAAHDWGGPIAIGAAASLEVRALILGNTAVAKPEGVSVPPLIATARRATDLVCRRTPTFVRGTARMTSPEHREALRAPYRTADRRPAVADFVADIPLTPDDRSWDALRASAQSFDRLAATGVPILLVWGGRDPVFHDRFLADLVARAPRADVHRFAAAGHLVPLDEPMADVAAAWLDETLPDASTPSSEVSTGAPAEGGAGDRTADGSSGTFRPITAALQDRADDDTRAYADADDTLTWRQLHERVERAAGHLVATGLRPGDRVAMLVPPGADLLVAAYGTWMAGGVPVVADRGLGIRGMRAALHGATPNWVIGTRRTLVAAKVTGLTPGARRASLGRVRGAVDLTAAPLGATPELPTLAPDDVAAVVHTSGATGPAKPVRYTHGALAAQRAVVASSFAITGDEAFTTSFAPFVLLGPALGVPCVLPDIDVTRPGDLDFDKLADVCRDRSVGVAWLSPASARSIATTAGDRRVPMRLVMLAGAPIDADLVRAITLVTGADVRAPYGMTEAMPLTDGTDASRAGPLGGTATGWPLDGVEIVIVPLDEPLAPELPSGEWGEILVRAPWMRAGYDRRWATNDEATIRRGGTTFHRTQDVGYRDGDGRVFQLGRARHVVHTTGGPRASVALEQPVAAATGRSVAAVGVGPRGAQVVAIVVDAPGRLRLAPAGLTRTVRSASAEPVAAVVEGPLPVDIRHRSKIDRSGLAADVSSFLAGR
jgi:acyl-coenzyme A synthetase/AMP-(fatty) acid ligase/pimeloyl-ACP methyl ester carboxylesterase